MDKISENYAPKKNKKLVDKEVVFQLAAIMCTNDEIGQVLGLSPTAIKMKYAKIIEQGRAEGKKSLRRAQFQVALEKKDVSKWSSVSLIALKTVLDSITTGCTQTKASVKIGNSLEDEARLLFFQENDAKTYSRTKQWLKSKNNYRYKKRIYVYAMNKHNLEFGVWAKQDKIHLVMTLIYLIMVATGGAEN